MIGIRVARANWIKCSRRGIMARAPGVSKTAPSATKAFCMSMTIRTQLRGSMVKKFFPEALRLEDMASPSVYLSHRPEHATSPGLPKISWFSSCEAFDGRFQLPPAQSLALRYGLDLIRRFLLQSLHREFRQARLCRFHILQANDVRTGVMAHRINDGLPDFDHLSLAFGVEDGIARCRRNQGNAQRRDDLTAAMRVTEVHGLAQRKVWREIARGHVAAR